MRPRAAALGLVAVMALSLALAACNTNPQSDIAAAEVALTEAESIALRYVTQPTCNGMNAPLCSDPATVEQIKAADNKAYAAVKAARRLASPSPAEVAVATAAVAELTALTNRLPGRER